MTVRMTNRTLPGVGGGQELLLRDGHRIAVVTRHDGARELALDAVVLRLDEDEADALAGLLGSAKLVSRLTRLQRDADALLAEQVPLRSHSPYVGRSLGETAIRHRTGASVVAVLRDGHAQPSPKPDYVLEARDLVVVVGTREGIDHAAHILDGTG